MIAALSPGSPPARALPPGPPSGLRLRRVGGAVHRQTPAAPALDGFSPNWMVTGCFTRPPAGRAWRANRRTRTSSVVARLGKDLAFLAALDKLSTVDRHFPPDRRGAPEQRVDVVLIRSH